MPDTDPYRAYGFKLRLGDSTEGHFSECSSPSIEVDRVSHREAGNRQPVRPIPGPVEYAAVTLKYGLTNSTTLWDWMMGIAEGNIDRRDVTIAFLDSQGERDLMRWELYDAWPSEWQGASLNDMEKGIAIESLTLVFEGIERTE